MLILVSAAWLFDQHLVGKDMSATRAVMGDKRWRQPGDSCGRHVFMTITSQLSGQHHVGKRMSTASVTAHGGVRRLVATGGL